MNINALALRMGLAAVSAGSFCISLSAAQPTPAEIEIARQWQTANIDSTPSKLPFSFTYGGRPSSQLLPLWKKTVSNADLDGGRKQHTTTFSDPKTGLVVRCVRVSYGDYPAVEWTLYFKNDSTSATPILENINALDSKFTRGKEGEFLLHYSNGSPRKPTDYEPLSAKLLPKTTHHLAPVGGRPTDGAFPYFNLEGTGQRGTIIAIGWPGQWAADFTRDKGVGLRVRAGQELTHFKLMPGEEVRTPLVVLHFYKGDWIRAQNVWRAWMLAYNTPRPGGSLPKPQLAGGSCPFFGPFIHNNEENQKLFIERYEEKGIKLDYWWIDAGWYPNNGAWQNTGTWEVDKQRFPHGLRAVSDYAHARGIKFILWFEPERVTPDTWLYEKHPEWLLKVAPTPSFPPSQKNWRLLNLGDPTARKWLTDHIDKFITSEGVDTYRQDFNIEPLPFWRANDAPDRQGITEIRYVTGYLAYWDELRKRHPNMSIDTCASGGRRNDLETLRRSVPLWRSDYIVEPVGMQNQTYGISLWFPYEGLASNLFETPDKKSIDKYAFRSDIYPSIHAHWDVRRDDLDYKQLRELIAQWRQIGPNYLGDYYPLTPYDAANSVWMAWQFNRPKAGEGAVQAFRRRDNKQESVRLKLHGLAPDTRYTLVNVDNTEKTVLTGRELMANGLPITLKESPGSAIILYKPAETR